MDSSDSNLPIKVGTHDGCGGSVMSAQFSYGMDRYCVKCGGFGASATPLASPLQNVYLIAVGFEHEFTCSTGCMILDPSDGVECRDAIVKAMKLATDSVDEVLVVMNNEVVYQHGGQDGFRKKIAKKVA